MMEGANEKQPSLRILDLNIRGLENKLHHLGSLVAKYRPDIVTLQETNVHSSFTKQAIVQKLKLQNTIFNYALHQHSGTAILQTSDTWELSQGKRPVGGRVILGKIKHGDFEYNLVNLHAPSGAATEQHHRPEFFKQLADQILPLTDRHRTIIVGDFNITLEDRDIVGTSGIERVGRSELKELVDALNLQDSYRCIHPTQIDTTHANTGAQRAARLDRLYAPKATKIQAHAHLEETLIFTDHKEY